MAETEAEVAKIQKPESAAVSKPKPETHYSSLHESIRTKLDAESVWISDEDIQLILRVACGDRRRAIQKCLLCMWYKAQHEKNAQAAVEFRHRLTAFEDGRLVL